MEKSTRGLDCEFCKWSNKYI